MIEVPPRLGPVPKAPGDPAGVENVAVAVRASSAILDDLDTIASSGSVPAVGGWSGQAADAYRSRVREVAVDAGTTSLTLRAVASAAFDYGDRLAELKRARRHLSEDRVDFNQARDDLAADAENADPDAEAKLRQRAERLRRRRDDLATDITKLAREITANEDAFREVLAKYATMESARSETSTGDPADNAMRLPGAPGSGSTPKEVAKWWAGLSDAQREALFAACPDVIGAANGLPAWARDRANRILLANDLAALEEGERRGMLSPAQERALRNARATQEALQRAEERLDPITHQPIKAFLHLFDPRAFGGDGTIAISVGNPDFADNVTTLVPGIKSDGTSATYYTMAAANLYESARLSDRHHSTAALFWIGYDAPSTSMLEFVTHTPGEGAAIAGGELLAKYIDGLKASRGSSQPHFTVVGHSYGSTTMAHAAHDYGMKVDDLVFLGSPGAGDGVDHVSDLGGSKVWVGNASRDAVARIGDNGAYNNSTFLGAGLGRNPAEDDFGATRFRAESPYRTDNRLLQLTAFDGSSFADHVRYWDRNSESLFNIGQIVVGDDGEVQTAEPVTDPLLGGPRDPEFRRGVPRQTTRLPDEP